MKTFYDIIFLFYFVSHIFITALFDSQLLFPTWLFPTAVSFRCNGAWTVYIGRLVSCRTWTIRTVCGLFTEFSEATNAYSTGGISKHRLSPYTAYCL